MEKEEEGVRGEEGRGEDERGGGWVLEGWKATERVRVASLWKGEVGAGSGCRPPSTQRYFRKGCPPIKSVWSGSCSGLQMAET